MKNGKLGVCLIGAGRAGMIHAVNFRAQVPNAYLAAVVEPSDAARAEACSTLGIETSYADYKDALANPEIDAVVIVTPTKYHCEIALAAAAAGKHILCEKARMIRRRPGDGRNTVLRRAQRQNGWYL